jgi:hypothetical protein
MITQQPELHELRCSHCSHAHLNPNDNRWCDVKQDWLLDIEEWIIEKVGCASNTNARQQIDRKVITLCGSVKFWDEYRKWNAIFTLQGNVVFSCGLSLKSGYEDLLSKYTADQIELVKKDLDIIHLRKIDLSDEIFVLNVGGYIGESTKREIAYAESKGKIVKYLEIGEEQK